MECRSTNCDYLARLHEMKSKNRWKLYGKNAIETEYGKYLYQEEVDGKTYRFDDTKIARLYSMFIYNIDQLLKYDIFTMKTIPVSKLLPATKGKIWDWTDDKEKEDCIDCIRDYGLYFPIFVLPEGIIHNQLDNEDSIRKRALEEGLYNSYNGNHRIDAIQSIGSIEEVKVLIIPPFCEKSCTGFHYTQIDYDKEEDLPSIVTDHFLPLEVVNELKLFHITSCCNDMKMYNIPGKNIYPDIDLVYPLDYQVCFRILQEFQNVLEVPLTLYYNQNRKLPKGIDTSWCNCNATQEHSNKRCPYMSWYDTCFITDTERECGIMVCCYACPFATGCDHRCGYYKEKEE